jgi:hypothetical protein
MRTYFEGQDKKPYRVNRVDNTGDYSAGDSAGDFRSPAE